MPETIPQIRPSFNRSLRLEDPPRVAQCGHGSPGATGADGSQRPHRLVDRAVARSATPEFDPLSVVGSAADSTPAAGAGLARPVRRRPPASGSELAGGEPDPSGHGGLGGGPRAGVAADLVPTAGHAQPGGEPSGPAPGGDGAGVPPDRDDRRPAAKTGEKEPHGRRDGKRRWSWTWTVSRSRSMGIPREANGTDTIASGCTTGWWRVVPRRGT